MTVHIGARLAADGSGSFTLGMDLDEELVDGLKHARGESLATIDGLFERLRATGWQTTRKESAHGLSYSARREFSDLRGFDAAVAELGGAGGSEGARAPFTLGLSSNDSFFSKHGRFSGEIDTTSFLRAPTPRLQRVLDSLREAVADVVHFRIQVAMPGAVSIEEGSGTVRDGVAVWRPAFGARTRFVAASSALKPVPLALVGLPGLVLLAALVWLLSRRRQAPLGERLPEPRPVPEPLGATPATALVRISDFPSALPAANGVPERVIALDGLEIDLTEPAAMPEPRA